MKQEWQSPVLEVLDINMTMAGPGKRLVDQVLKMRMSKALFTTANALIFK